MRLASNLLSLVTRDKQCLSNVCNSETRKCEPSSLCVNGVLDGKEQCDINVYDSNFGCAASYAPTCDSECISECVLIS